MDKIDEGEEEKFVGSRFVACMWICTKVVLFDCQEFTQEYLRRRLFFIMTSVNWSVKSKETSGFLKTPFQCRKTTSEI